MSLPKAKELLERGALDAALKEMERWRLENMRWWSKVAELMAPYFHVSPFHSVAETVESCAKSWRAVWRCVCVDSNECRDETVPILRLSFGELCTFVILTRSSLMERCLDLAIRLAEKLYREMA